MRLRPALGLFLLLLSACAGSATQAQLLKRAAFDLRCQEDQIAVVELDPRTRGVDGCGQRATYVELCKPCANGYQGCECSWVLNTDATRAPPEGATAP